jgi:transposase
MARAYGDDLRRKFYEAYQRGDGSQAVLAARFGVSRSWAESLMRTLRRTGRVEKPAAGKRGPASKPTPELRETLQGWIQQQPDLTLAELQLRLWDEHELEVSLSRLWTVLGEMGLGLKKSHSTPPNRTRPQLASSASAGVKRPVRSTRRS